MTSLSVENVSLVYRIWHKLSLAAPDRRINKPGRIVSEGRTGYVTALDGVSFALEKGDRLGLIGANGAGKTTLLKVLYGIYEPSGGKVVMNGKVDALFNIGLGFRQEATGRRNIEIRGLINGWTQREIDYRMKEIIEFSELGDFIDMPLKSYSLGMSTRLAFSVATSFEPEILLMDEWIGAGDASFQQKAKIRMDSIARKAGIIVLASHNYDLLRKTCNKVMRLEQGRIAGFGPSEEMLAEQAA